MLCFLGLVETWAICVVDRAWYCEFDWVCLLLTRTEAAFAGRAYAAYGGVYIATSLLWLWVVEQMPPDRWDVLGAGLCFVGAMLILWGPRPLYSEVGQICPQSFLTGGLTDDGENLVRVDEGTLGSASSTCVALACCKARSEIIFYLFFQPAFP